MDAPYGYDDGYETYYDGNGNSLGGLGDTAPATAPADATPSWLQQITSGLTSIGQSVATIQASKQIAKTGQVPTAQVNVGVAPDVQKKLMIGGGIAAGLLVLYLVMKKR